MATQTVEALLARAELEEADKLRQITVHKELELQLDLGNMLACDPNPPDTQGRRAGSGAELEERLKALARDNTQLLVNALWALPAERLPGGEAVLVARLPEPSLRLPREKPPPRPRAPTRWEQFAKLKGIQKRKKTNLVWDEARGEWRRRWGYKRAGDDTKDWLIEVPESSADPERDLFGERRKAKREMVAKNELNRLRNIARAQRSGDGRVPGPGGLAPVKGGTPSRDQLGRAMQVARSSTASVGRFQERLPREKEILRGSGKKRHFEPLIGDLGAERSRQLELLGLMQSKKPKLDVTRAAHKQMREEDSEAAAFRRRQPKKAGRSSKGPGGKGRGKGSKTTVGKRKTTGGKGKIPGGKGRSPGGKRNRN